MLHYAAPLHGLSIRFERNEKEGYRRKKKIENADEIHWDFFIWRGIIFILHSNEKRTWTHERHANPKYGDYELNMLFYSKGNKGIGDEGRVKLKPWISLRL